VRNLNRNLPSANNNTFAMVPRSDVPRSTFPMQWTHKAPMDGNKLIPITVEEVLPGDHWRGNVTIFCRAANLLFPLMDNIELETFFFFVPCRLVWSNWEKFMGEQNNPADSINYTIPVQTSPTGGWGINTLHDYMGIPTVGQTLAGNTITINTLS